MGRHWERQDMDIKILEILDKYKALRGTTIAKLVSRDDIQRGHNRLKALKSLKLVESVPYTEEISCRKRKFVKKMGALSYLTTRGVAELKKIRGQTITGTERNQRPDEDQCRVLFQASVLMENIPLQFGDPRQYKNEKELKNFFMVDMVYNEWQIVFQRNTSVSYKKKLLEQSIQAISNESYSRIILTPTWQRLKNLLEFWIKSKGPTVRFLIQNDYINIQRFLRGTITDEAIDTLKSAGYRVEKYSFPRDGFLYKINEKPANILDLVGFPLRGFRQLNTLEPGSYIILSDESSLQFINKLLPGKLDPFQPIILGKAVLPIKQTQTQTETSEENKIDPWEVLLCENSNNSQANTPEI